MKEFHSLILRLKEKNAQDISEFSSTISSLSISNLKELLETFSPSDQKNLFVALSSIVDSSLEEIQDENQDDEVIEGNVVLLHSITRVVLCFLKFGKAKTVDSENELSALVFSLHDSLNLFYQLGGKLGDAVSSACETWWIQDRSKREDVVPQTLSFLLLTCLEEGKVSLIQRLFKFRSALMVVDFQDESIVAVKSLLLRCCIHPAFLRCKEGRGFLVSLFGLHPSFIEDIHEAIKSQVCKVKKNEVEHYGEVYFKAWRSASGPYLIKVEYSCLQDFIERGVHLANSASLKAVRSILHAFHEQKNVRGVDETLLKLYDPIIWRALSSPNAHVRRNAVHLLGDSFPLGNNSCNSQRESDELLQKQFGFLESLLTDDSPDVRTESTLAVSRILGVYWDMIPSEAVKKLLSILFEDLLCDSSSPSVRAAVIDGVRFTLDNHVAQSTLKPLLPKLSPFIHDRSEKVRSSLCRLLLSIKSMRFIKYYDIVAAPQLLSRFPLDGPTTRKSIAELLLNSYFPHTKSLSIQLKRCIVLTRSHPDAVVPFYSTVSQFDLVPLSDCAKFIGCIYDALVQGQGSPFSPTETKLLLEIAVVIWDNITHSLNKPVNKSILGYLLDTVTEEGIQDLLSNSTDPQIFRLASHLPHSRTKGLRKECLRLFRECLQNNDEEESIEKFQELTRCLVSWESSENLLRYLCTSLRSTLEQARQPTSEKNLKRRKNLQKGGSIRSRRRTETQSSELIDPTMSLRALEFLLAEHSLRPIVLEQPCIMDLMTVLSQYLELVQDAITTQAESVVPHSVLLSTLDLNCKLFMHVSASFGQTLPEQDVEPLKQLIFWTEDVLLPSIRKSASPSKKRKQANKESTSEFIGTVVQKIASILSECITLSFCTSDLRSKIADIISEITKVKEEIAPVALKTIFHLNKQSHDNNDSSLRLLEASFRVKSPPDKENCENQSSSLALKELLRAGFKPFIEDLSTVLIGHMQDFDVDMPVMASKMAHVQPTAAFIMESLLRNTQSLRALSLVLERRVRDANMRGDDIGVIWKCLEIISVLLQSQEGEKRPTDLSSIQNTLFSLKSQLPKEPVDMQEMASKLLQSSLLE